MAETPRTITVHVDADDWAELVRLREVMKVLEAALAVAARPAIQVSPIRLDPAPPNVREMARGLTFTGPNEGPALGWCSQCGQALNADACGPTHALRWHRRVNADALADLLDVAETRLDQARRALLADGYFTPEQVGDDIAPRILERFAAFAADSPAPRDEAP